MAKVVTQKKEYVPKSAFNKKSHYSDYVKLSQEYFGNNPSSAVQQYKKSKSKPKKLSLLIVNTLVICSLVVLVVVTSVVCIIFAGGGANEYVDNRIENVHEFIGLAVPPDLNSSQKLDISHLASAREKAAYLYDLCSANATKTPYFTAYNKGLLSLYLGSSGNFIDIDAVTMKTQKEYFNIEYHLKNSVPILDSFIGPMLAKTTDIITTARRYATDKSSKVIYQKVKNNEYDENGVPYASWDAAIGNPEQKELPMIVFNASQNGNFKITNHTITAETISDAEVTYDAKNHFYHVSLTLDPTNPDTIEYSIDDIRAGTGDKNAQYTQIKIDFTVWDTGYFRTFSLVEKWSANLVIALNFQLETNWECSYDERDCQIDTYNDSKIMKQSLGLLK